MKSLISEINCEIVHKKIPKVKHLHSAEAEKIKAMVHTQDPNFFEKTDNHRDETWLDTFCC